MGRGEARAAPTLDCSSPPHPTHTQPALPTQPLARPDIPPHFLPQAHTDSMAQAAWGPCLPPRPRGAEQPLPRPWPPGTKSFHSMQ